MTWTDLSIYCPQDEAASLKQTKTRLTSVLLFVSCTLTSFDGFTLTGSTDWGNLTAMLPSVMDCTAPISNFRRGLTVMTVEGLDYFEI